MMDWMQRWIGWAAGAVWAALAGAALVWWLSLELPFEIAARVPAEHAPEGGAASAQAWDQVDIEGEFAVFDAAVPPALEGDWPQFRGPGRDNVCAEPAGLSTDWPSNGPPVLWSVALGEGHAGPAVLNGRVYVLDYDEAFEGDALRCFALADGRELWRRAYKCRIKRNHGMSRTVPAVSDRYVVSVGPKCHVLCVDAGSGSFRWGMDMVRRFGTEVPLWYTGQCPLIDEDTAVLAPAGDVLLAGVSCDTGEPVWQTPNPRGWKMSHSSVMPMRIAGKRMYVYFALGGVAGVSAEPEDRGRLLWECSDWAPTVVAPSPVAVGDGRVLLTAGYGAGSAMLRVTESNGTFAASVLYTLDRQVFGCEQQTPVLHDGVFYSVLPNDAGARRRELACLDPGGTLLWSSGKDDRFGLGPFLLAGDKMFVLDDRGVLSVLRVGREGHTRLARAQVLDGRDAWGPMALVGARLLLRDSTRMVCLDLRLSR